MTSHTSFVGPTTAYTALSSGANATRWNRTFARSTRRSSLPVFVSQTETLPSAAVTSFLLSDENAEWNTVLECRKRAEPNRRGAEGSAFAGSADFAGSAGFE